MISLTSSCIKDFKHKTDIDNDITSGLEIPRDVHVYDDYLTKAPLIKILLLKDVKQFNLAISSPAKLFAINYPSSNSFDDASSKPLLVSLQPENDHKLIKRFNNLSKSNVTLTDQHILIGTKKFKREPIEIVAENGGKVEINNINYDGAIIIIPKKNGAFLVIEETEVENFLLGVLGSEMPLSWEKNTLFAQAVAARTFILYKMKKRDAELYQISKLDLAYKGRKNVNRKTLEIVNKSKGIIMVYNWKIFPGYFHSTCGGHTEDVYRIFKEKSIAPLTGVSCGYCESSKHFRWQTNVKKENVVKKLYRKNKKASSSLSIRPIDLGSGGHAATIEIRNAGKTKKMDANRFRLLIGPNKLKSTAFTVHNSGENLNLSGKGWGHGVGLCQYGSQKMGLLGFKWHEILKHYYPEIELVKVY